MKKKLLLLAILVCISNFLNSQTIDIIGVGTLGATGLGNRNLALTDIATITKVDVGTPYKGSTSAIPNGTDVQFYDNDEGPFSTWKTQPDLIVKHFSPSFGETLGYFEATFNTFDNGGVNVSIVPINEISSFYAFVHRNSPTATYKSYISDEVIFLYRNGSADPYVYSIPINTASAQRNITVKIPISELDDGLVRKAVIDITAGAVTEHVEVNLFNLGNSFFLGEYVLANVPGNISEVTVSIYSPNDLIGEDSGDSFFVNGIVADVDIVEDQNPGCTLTQGYWKTHSSCKKKGPKRDDTWDELPNAEETVFFLAGQDYCEVFDTKPGKGGKYYILAHQYIAAQLNMLNGADPSDAQVAFDEATDFLNAYTPEDVDNDQVLQSKAVELGGVLADYNEGTIGPGHCDDGDSYKVAEDTSYSRINIYPNPVADYGTISLDSNHKGRTTIELYNNKGRRVDVLYDSKFKVGESKVVEFSTSKYKKGKYFVIIKDGNTIHKKQIVVK